MAARSQPIDNPEAAFVEIFRLLDQINDSMRDRLLPPGFVVNNVGGDIVITRSDGATSTLVFA